MLYWSDMLGDQNLATMLQVQGKPQQPLRPGRVPEHGTPAQLGDRGGADPVSAGRYLLGQSAAATRSTSSCRSSARSTERPTSSSPIHSALFSGWSCRGRAQHRLLRAGRDPGVLASDRAAPVRQHLDLPTLPSVTLFTTAAALVYDNSFFGATSPILGQRWRLEVDPTVGSLQFYTLLADYRKYLMPVRPFTIAARLLHYGGTVAMPKTTRSCIRCTWLPEPVARLRLQLAWRLGQRGLRSAARHPAPRGQPGAALPAPRRSGPGARLLRRLPHRSRDLRRRRRGLAPGQTPSILAARAAARASCLPAPASRSE